MLRNTTSVSVYNRLVIGFLCLLLLVVSAIIPEEITAMEYGETGPYSVERKSFENQMWPGNNVTVLLPAERSGPVPVMFFSHGLGGIYWWGYRSLLEHVASQGVAVVFSPYPTSFDWQNQYGILWNGFKEAANRFAADFDLEKVGFAGHSWGGGATPNMTVRAKDAGWGRLGMFMFIMAPAPAQGVSDAQLQNLSDVNVIMQVYENDTITPHSWAEASYGKFGTYYKAWYFVLGADHRTPSEREVNDLDRLAVWKPLDALMDYTFQMSTPYAGMLFALYGEGDHYQTIVTGINGTPQPPENDDPVDPPAEEEPSDDNWSWGDRWRDSQEDDSRWSWTPWWKR